MIANPQMPLWNNAHVLGALVMGDGAVIIGVVNVEAPTAVLPQGAVPFSVVRFFVTAFETIGEGGALAFVTLVLGDSMQLETVFAFNIAPLILRWSLSGKNMG